MSIQLDKVLQWWPVLESSGREPGSQPVSKEILSNFLIMGYLCLCCWFGVLKHAPLKDQEMLCEKMHICTLLLVNQEQ